jgi:hypothetical protein
MRFHQEARKTKPQEEIMKRLEGKRFHPTRLTEKMIERSNE